MRVLFFGTYDDQRNPRVQILREGFAANGHAFEECVVPIGFSTDRRVLMLRRPWLLPLLISKLLLCWSVLLWRSRHHRRPDVVVVGYMGHLDVHLARLRYRRVPIVLDHLVSLTGTAADRRVTDRPFTHLLAKVDSQAVRAADVVLVDTEEHLDELPVRWRDRGLVVPVGAQQRTFSSPAVQAPLPPLRVVFYGHYIPLQGAAVIGEAIAVLYRRERHDILFTMIGRGQDLGEARRRTGDAPSVHWIDRILGREELTEVVSRHHVGLGIFGTTAKTYKVVPTKVYESAAAGLAVVTADTPPQRRTLGGAAFYVPPGDPEALAGALETLADDPEHLARLTKQARTLAREQFSPGSVVQPLIDRLVSARWAEPHPPL